jgi:hypothetical protein
MEPLDLESSRSGSGLALPLAARQPDPPFDGYSTTISRVEIRSSLFHFAHRLLLLLLFFLSCLSAVHPLPDQSDGAAALVQSLTNAVSLHPALFESPDLSMEVLLFLLGALSVVSLFQLAVALALHRGYVLSDFVLQAWVLVSRVLLPLPSLALGAHFGHFLLRFAQDLAAGSGVLLSVACLVLWFWSVVSAV